MKKALFIVMIAMLILCGCAKKETAEEENEVDDQIEIGMSFDSFVIERWERDRDVFVSSIKDAGGQVYVQVADGDIEEQKEQIKYLINKGVDAIVIVAVDCESLADEVKEAKDAGIYVVSYDRMILDADIDLLVTFDNTQVGRLMAEGLKDSLKPFSKIVCINGSMQDNNVKEVQAGFAEIIDGTNLTVVRSDYCPNWEAEKAYDIMQDVLTSDLEFDAVMCGNDDIATMVYKALSERGLADGIVLVGQDADLAACQRIVNGWQAMTVYKSVESLARTAAEETLNLINDGKSSAEITVNNRSKDVPAILYEPVAVNSDNMQSVIIDGGFHLYKEVYGE